MTKPLLNLFVKSEMLRKPVKRYYNMHSGNAHLTMSPSSSLSSNTLEESPCRIYMATDSYVLQLQGLWVYM